MAWCAAAKPWATLGAWFALALACGSGCVDIGALRERVSCEPGTCSAVVAGANAGGTQASLGAAGGGGITGSAGSAGRSSRTACDPDPCAGMPNRTCDEGSGVCACNHRCDALEATRCNEQGLSVCRADADGCRDWTKVLDCPNGCGDAVSCAGCRNACAQPGVGTCKGDQIELCAADAQGCLVLNSPVSCADQVPCTADRCNPELGRCENAPQDSLCTEHAGNPCMRDSCDASTGCVSTPVDGSCSDNQSCTVGDTCSNGVCAGELDSQMAGCVDLCPNDNTKSAPGVCGCGVPEDTFDSDNDGTIDCMDACPDDQCRTAGEVTCTAGALERCMADTQGCLSLVSTTCSGGYCFTPNSCGAVTITDWGASAEGNVDRVGIDGQGNAFVVGTTSANLNGASLYGEADAFLTKWSPTATRQWTRLFGTSTLDYGQAVAVRTDGRVAVAGATYATLSAPNGPTAGNQDAFAVLLGAGAAASTQPTFSVQFGSRFSQWKAAAFGASDALYVAGSSAGAGTSEDVLIARLHPSTGAVQWMKSWGSASLGDGGIAIAASGSKVYVLSAQDNGSASTSVGTLTEHDATTGNELWRKTWSDWGSSALLYEMAEIAVDKDGAIIVAASLGDGSETRITKLRPDHSEVWTKMVPAYADALAVDDTGAIYRASGWVLFKYAADGTAQWDVELTNMNIRSVAAGRDSSGTLRVAVAGDRYVNERFEPMFALLRAE